MRRPLLFSIIGLLALALVPAQASVIQYALTSDHCTGSCGPAGTTFGTITLTDLAAGTLAIIVRGGDGKTGVALQTVEPIQNAVVRVIPADAAESTDGVGASTGPDGTLQLMVPVTAPQKAVLTINGKQVTSEPFDLSKHGGRLSVIAQWGNPGRLQAVFDAKPGTTLYAESAVGGPPTLRR